MGKNVSKTTLKYLRVTRGGKEHKVFMRDVAAIYVRRRFQNKPTVPPFEGFLAKGPAL